MDWMHMSEQQTVFQTNALLIVCSDARTLKPTLFNNPVCSILEHQPYSKYSNPCLPRVTKCEPSVNEHPGSYSLVLISLVSDEVWQVSNLYSSSWNSETQSDLNLMPTNLRFNAYTSLSNFFYFINIKFLTSYVTP